MLRSGEAMRQAHSRHQSLCGVAGAGRDLRRTVLYHTRSPSVCHLSQLLSAVGYGFVANRRVSVRPVRASNKNSGGNNSNDEEPKPSNSNGIPAGLLLFVGAAAYTLTNMREELSDLLYDDDTIGDLAIAGLGLGDVTGAVLWAVALWYVSPLQLLLVFLGRFEAERPSDWIMNKLGRAAQQPVDAIDYTAPLWIKAAAAASCAAGGLAVAALLGNGLGDPTWSVSSGIGALFGAAIFELGRPTRLSVQEAQQLESQWQDFAAFADRRLQRSGRCHESEVFLAFRRSNAKYRSADVLSDAELRDMVRNWQPGVERTRTGYLRNISLRTAAAAVASTNGSRGIIDEQQQQQEGPSAEPSLLDNIADAAAEDLKKQAANSGSSSST